MYSTDLFLLLGFLASPIVCLATILIVLVQRRRLNDQLRAYWQQFAHIIDKDTDLDTYKRSVNRALSDLAELRDNHENLYTQFKKFRSKVTMAERRKLEDGKPDEDTPEVETTEQWKARKRLELFGKGITTK